MINGSQERILELLQRFNSGTTICIDILSKDILWEGKSEKTIRRDLDAIKKFFPHSFERIQGKKGCYKAITKNIFNQLIDKERLALLVQTFNIAQQNNFLDTLNIKAEDKKIIAHKIEKSKECYHFISKPFETKKGDTLLLKEIEKAIIWRRYSTLFHRERGEIKEYQIKPYKIIFINEIFYLATENLEGEFPFSLFRVSNIQEIQHQSKTFQINPDIADFIQYMQTPFSLYKTDFRKYLITVKLVVSKEKARFFKVKKFLPSQKVEEERDDGSLIISFLVTKEMEVEEMIKKWIPHLNVISPLSLKEKIEEDLRGYLGLI